VTVWVFVVSTFLAIGGVQVGVVGQARQKTLGKFVFPTPASCEAARSGVREFADTAGRTLMIGHCQEESRSPRASVDEPDG
jgi:hypothetical protein